MTPLHRLLEVSLYTIVDFFPLVFMALYPFQSKLRFSYRITLSIVILLTLFQIVEGLYISYYPNVFVWAIRLTDMFIYALFYLLVVKVTIGKLLFTLLIVSNLGNYIMVLAKYLEGIFFPELASNRYGLPFSLMMLLVDIAVIIPVFLFLKKVYLSAFVKDSSSLIWNYLWVIPAIFYFIWFYNIYCFYDAPAMEIASKPQSALYLTVVNMGFFLIFYVIIKLIENQQITEDLKIKILNLTMQKHQYASLNEQILDARRARHDVRHHISVMKEYLDRGEYDKLNTYLQNYEDSLPTPQYMNFCENKVANTILIHFAYKAKLNQIDFMTEVSIPQSIFVSEPDLSIVLGNLIENALDACISENSLKKKIIIHAKYDINNLWLTVDNTFHGSLAKTTSGKILSTKHEGIGLGISSVESISTKYNGSFKIDQTNNMFCASVFLSK